jgi:hypothetical protein
MASQGASQVATQVASQEVEPAAAVAEPEPMKALEPLPRLPDEDPLDQEGDTTGSSAASADPSGQPDSSPTGAADLSLRFASDRDFMRLVTRGDIQVYAFRDRDVLSLDRSFHFLETPAPTRVYALEPKTIPALVTAALSARRDDADTFDWGIRMPERLETRIRDFLDQGATGALVIDRYGEVLHVAGG